MSRALLVRGFTFTQYIAARIPARWNRDQPQGFCAEFRHDSGALTRVIDQLAQRGFVDRLRGQQDRRKVDLQLTPAGRKAVESLIPLVVDGLNTALEAFTAAEVGELARLLVKLNNTLDVRVAARPGAARPIAARPIAARPIAARPSAAREKP